MTLHMTTITVYADVSDPSGLDELELADPMIGVRWLHSSLEPWLPFEEARQAHVTDPGCCLHHRTWFPMTACWVRPPYPYEVEFALRRQERPTGSHVA